MNIKELPKDVSKMWTYIRNMSKDKWIETAKHVAPGLAVGAATGMGTIALAGSPDEHGKKNYLGGALLGAGADLAILGAGPAWRNRMKILPSLFKKSEHTEKTWEKSEARKQMIKGTLDKTLATLFEKNPEVDANVKLRKAAGWDPARLLKVQGASKVALGKHALADGTFLHVFKDELGAIKYKIIGSLGEGTEIPKSDIARNAHRTLGSYGFKRRGH